MGGEEVAGDRTLHNRIGTVFFLGSPDFICSRVFMDFNLCSPFSLRSFAIPLPALFGAFFTRIGDCDAAAVKKYRLGFKNMP